jgi:hypothetical protein
MVLKLLFEKQRQQRFGYNSPAICSYCTGLSHGPVFAAIGFISAMCLHLCLLYYYLHIK